MNIKILTLGLLSIFIGCGQNNLSTQSKAIDAQTINDSTLGIRHVGLLNEEGLQFADVDYESSKMPGESTLIERAYENAPPLIPHSLEGLLPITADNNSCLSCHDKSLAEAMGATAVPPTHYVDFRTHKSRGDMVSSERFNCTQCHVPQSDTKIVIQNNFRTNFSNESLKNRSNLIDVLNEGVK